MYVKVFESRKTAKSYFIITPTSFDDFQIPYIENEKHEKVSIKESELFSLIDNWFKDKQNEARKGKESSNT
jgi:hypothetical protein